MQNLKDKNERCRSSREETRRIARSPEMHSQAIITSISANMRIYPLSAYSCRCVFIPRSRDSWDLFPRRNPVMYTTLYPMLIFCFARNPKTTRKKNAHVYDVSCNNVEAVLFPPYFFFHETNFQFFRPRKFPRPRFARCALRSLFPHRPARTRAFPPWAKYFRIDNSFLSFKTLLRPRVP